jgi:hypothetical protein
MIILIVMFGCVLGWVLLRTRVQRDVVNDVMRSAGRGTVVSYDWEYKDGNYIPDGRLRWPRWLVEFIGVDSHPRRYEGH